MGRALLGRCAALLADLMRPRGVRFSGFFCGGDGDRDGGGDGDMVMMVVAVKCCSNPSTTVITCLRWLLEPPAGIDTPDAKRIRGVRGGRLACRFKPKERLRLLGKLPLNRRGLMVKHARDGKGCKPEESKESNQGPPKKAPKASQPKASQPKASQPKVSQPKASQPKASQAKASQPKASQSAVQAAPMVEKQAPHAREDQDSSQQSTEQNMPSASSASQTVPEENDDQKSSDLSRQDFCGDGQHAQVMLEGQVIWFKTAVHFHPPTLRSCQNLSTEMIEI